MNISTYIESFKPRNIDTSELERNYRSLVERCEGGLDTNISSDCGAPDRIHKLSLALRQCLLHRALKLFEAALLAVETENAYSLALSVRGHYETTAALGYLHNRLHSYRNNTITEETMDKDIGVLLLGSRDEEILALAEDEDFEARQILNLLEYADKSVSKHIMGGSNNQHKMLTDIYKWLCEFCHPNFHSMKAAMFIDHERKMFIFKHSLSLASEEESIFDNLYVSNPVFIELYDKIPKLLPEI